MHWTKGLLIGDSIVANIFTNAKNVIKQGGKTLDSIAVAGHLVSDQYATWLASSNRGNNTYDWIFIMVGINDSLNGSILPSTSAATMVSLLADINANNRKAIILLDTMLPAKSRLDQVSANRYPLWKQLNALYAGLGGRTYISDLMNDGADSLQAQYQSGDGGLHPNNAGDQINAGGIKAWADRQAQRDQQRVRLGRIATYQKPLRRFYMP